MPSVPAFRQPKERNQEQHSCLKIQRINKINPKQ